MAKAWKAIVTCFVVLISFLTVMSTFVWTAASLGNCGQLSCVALDGKWMSKYDLEKEARKERLCSPTMAFSEENSKQRDALNSENLLSAKSNLRFPGGVNKVPEKTDKPRVWASYGSGWDLYVQLTSWPAEREVSSLDWAMRWEAATKCLSVQEPDNQDMFEIDAIALQAFWERVFACYQSYAHGTKE
ncbi:hypothetical protein Plec18167_006985 [Paecilomyces lecythidis]|uniref:Uncharacterized protein n=1 Tax=Paecilomyces lecythidis TaxID=3004212 RepID=A0ABR3X8A7_9EURO